METKTQPPKLDWGILPQNLTWNLQMMVSKRNHLFQGLLFRFHVKFQGCIQDMTAFRVIFCPENFAHLVWAVHQWKPLGYLVGKEVNRFFWECSRWPNLMSMFLYALNGLKPLGVCFWLRTFYGLTKSWWCNDPVELGYIVCRRLYSTGVSEICSIQISCIFSILLDT